ncbi:MAG TPA: hypothetical protein DCP91_05565 [Eggerthellaceae bacterium]|nr:hypothetical protein [Eggerthellaceae bacterium]
MAINFDELSPEQIQKGMACKSLDEFREFALSEGFDLGEEESKAVFEQIYEAGLSDKQLDAIAGGTAWQDNECTENQCLKYGSNRPRKLRKLNKLK